LPEFGAETQHHEAEDDAEAADEQQEAEVASVEDGACAGADEEDAYRPGKRERLDCGRAVDVWMGHIQGTYWIEPIHEIFDDVSWKSAPVS
jgi:hypothetical protein